MVLLKLQSSQALRPLVSHFNQISLLNVQRVLALAKNLGTTFQLGKTRLKLLLPRFLLPQLLPPGLRMRLFLLDLLLSARQLRLALL